MKSPRSDKEALIFSQLAQMKFKPSQCPLLKLKKQQDQSHVMSQMQRLESTIGVSYDMINKRIKYLFSLNQNFFLIGNENQLDLIGINGASFGFLDTEYFWSINLNEPIQNISIDTKKCFLALVFLKVIRLYTYNSKRFNEYPKLIKTIQIKNQVKFIQFAKESHLSIFYESFFQVFGIQENGRIVKKCQKNYNVTSQFKIFSVPQAVDSVLNIFFEKDSHEDQTFTLYSMKVVYDLVDIKIHQVQKVYDIIKSLKKKVRISNFSRDTFFLNMGCEIIAAKKGFIIDSISVNIQGADSKLIYLSNQKLAHVDESKVQLYDIKIDTSIKPNRIKIHSIDSLQIQERPKNSKLIDIITFGKDNFAIFFQLRPQYNNYTKGQVNYWFGLTQFIKKEEKIKKIFNYGKEISTLPQEIIESKCQMARKVGLSDKQIYLEIWNRTAKSTIQDYKFLLATKDFKTIHSQIEKKLKKQSMSFRELFNIFQSCLDILMKNVFATSQCTQENVQQYLTCHLLVRKLKLFKEMQMYERNNLSQLKLQRTISAQGESSLFMITIQEFYEYKNFDIKGFLIDHVNMFCQQKKNTITKIRLILRAFRFVYRVIYRELLDEIIINTKSNLLSLLQAVPQMLPHHSNVHEDEQVSLFEGIWKQITESEWENNLYIERIKTIDNAQRVNDVINSVWYKRYWLTTHDLIDKTRQEILEIHHRNASEEIFYYFISSIFLKIEDRKNLEVLVEFLENFYENLPSHIRGKIFLYVDLWGYYCEHHEEARRNKLNLNEFLRLKGFDLFKYFFDLEKVRKNCILKQIKPIYMKSKSEFPGIDVFNQGLLEYFESDLSEISDLKYLLNRMNNEKSQFHGNNVETYEILVQAMQIKLIIGGENDVPIEQTLIYIENIPLSKDNDVMAELEVVQRINEESERFREMKLNMSIRQIIDNCEDVISKVIQYEFKKHRIRSIKSIQQLKKITYILLAEIQTIKQKIYGQEMNNLPFFIYVSQILESKEQIPLASELLRDEFLNRYFTVNETIIQNLVLYMYKKRFSMSSVFKDHQDYVRVLVTLLPQSNHTRDFILNQLQFALLLSPPGEGVQFPISSKNAFPKVNELVDIVKFLPSPFITTVDIEKVYTTMRRMQQIEMMTDDDNSIGDEYFDQEFISKHQVYEIFITRMVELGLIQEAILLIRQIIKIQYPNEDYNTLYIILLILKISPELNDETKHGISSLISFDFEDQEKLLKIIEFYINSKITSLQKSNQITLQVSEAIKSKFNFNISHCQLFKDAFRQQIEKNESLKANGNLLIQSTWSHLRSTKPEFKDPFYQYVFIILTHEPYMLAKLINVMLDTINFKQLRSFISYLSIEEIFDEVRVLEFSRRVFYLVLHSNIENEEIDHKLFNFEKVDLEQHVFFKQYFNLTDESDIKLLKSLKACQNKSKIIQGPRGSRRSQSKSQQQSIHIKIHHPENITESSPSQYPYDDSDDDQNDEVQSPRIKIRSKNRRAKIQFDEKSQRNKFMNREGKKFGAYMKQHVDTENGSEKHVLDTSKTIKIKSRITSMSRALDKDVKIKRAMTLSYNPQNSRSKVSSQYPEIDSPQAKKKKMFLDLIKSPSNKQLGPYPLQSPQMKKKVSKRKTSQLIVSSSQNRQDMKKSEQPQKQKSEYGTKQPITSNPKVQTYETLLEQLFEEYDIETKQFNLQKLRARSTKFGENQAGFTEELKKLIELLYESIDNQTQIKINLIKSIATVFQQLNIKHMALSVYTQLLSLIDKYSLNISIRRLLPFEGLYTENISSLFELSKAKIIEASTLENLSKLSKVVSLAFRKNLYQQQIAYYSLCKIINEMQAAGNMGEVEINLCFEEIHQIVAKLSTKMLRQKGELQYREIQNGQIKDRLIQLILSVVKNKGDTISVNVLKKALKVEVSESYQSRNLQQY